MSTNENKYYHIKWKKEDYSKLRKAVSDFNKIVDELEKKETSVRLPKKLVYKEVKSNIVTRKQFNEQISDIEKFKVKENQNSIMFMDTLEQVTKWEYNIVNRNKNRLKREYKKELEDIEKSGIIKTSTESNKEKLRQQIKNIDRLWKKEKYELVYQMERVMKVRCDR